LGSPLLLQSLRHAQEIDVSILSARNKRGALAGPPWHIVSDFCCYRFSYRYGNYLAVVLVGVTTGVGLVRATVEGIVVVVEVVVVVGLIYGPMVLIGVMTPVLGLMDTAVQLLPAKPLGGEIEDNGPNGVPPVTMALLPAGETGTTETVPPLRNCIVTPELEDKTVLLGL
jgi:hypothetical protein